jgi:hypothetical protein
MLTSLQNYVKPEFSDRPTSPVDSSATANNTAPTKEKKYELKPTSFSLSGSHDKPATPPISKDSIDQLFGGSREKKPASSSIFGDATDDIFATPSSTIAKPEPQKASTPPVTSAVPPKATPAESKPKVEPKKAIDPLSLFAQEDDEDDFVSNVIITSLYCLQVYVFSTKKKSATLSIKEASDFIGSPKKSATLASTPKKSLFEGTL